MKAPKHILITGASSGIGEALAYEYAGPGVILALTGRNAARLEAVAHKCREDGAEVHQAVLDVTARDMMHKWIYDLDARFEFDLVIANAGISGGTGSVSCSSNTFTKNTFTGEPPEQVRNIFDVNVGGVFNTIDPVLPNMAQRGRGQIAIMSSLAGFRGFPGAPSYGGSKAAVKVYGEGLRGAMHHTGVEINVICPGFVVSRMTAVNNYKMPFLMNTAKAAKIIQRGLRRNKARIAFPVPTFFMAWFFSILPDSWVQPLLRGLPQKPTLHD